MDIAQCSSYGIAFPTRPEHGNAEGDAFQRRCGARRSLRSQWAPPCEGPEKVGVMGRWVPMIIGYHTMHYRLH